MDLHRLRSPWTRKITFFAFFLYICVSVINITEKRITAESSNLVFNICIIYRCYLILFIKIGQKLCVQGHTNNSNTFRLMKGICCQFIFVHLACTKCNKISIHFWNAQMYVTKRMWYECHSVRGKNGIGKNCNR